MGHLQLYVLIPLQTNEWNGRRIFALLNLIWILIRLYLPQLQVVLKYVNRELLIKFLIEAPEVSKSPPDPSEYSDAVLKVKQHHQ